ncbi:MAG: AbrB/MazE/SpoVT family DNA-binding domain-containing protein [Spirochaetes bacterium]|nr:AbrB/MazE/SpoVT family DNA-binding domain-containing protein [Spirochaetota bacterium]
MVRTRVFKSGDSQAVRIPKAFRFSGKEVYIEKSGDTIILRPTTRTRWDTARKAILEFSGDIFADGREQPDMQHRPKLNRLFS